jgi:RiboL-PSP-HEPN
MSAKLAFDAGIKDADDLLAHFDRLNIKPPPPENEVLKRASLIMALTAWETYVEDRVSEAVVARNALTGESIEKSFLNDQLKQELSRFHNPNAEKTKHLFLQYVGVDVTKGWKMSGYDVASAIKKLNELVKTRGEAVHRSKAVGTGQPKPHLISRDGLNKSIRFLKALVETTEKYLAKELAKTVK